MGVRGLLGMHCLLAEQSRGGDLVNKSQQEHHPDDFHNSASLTV